MNVGDQVITNDDAVIFFYAKPRMSGDDARGLEPDEFSMLLHPRHIGVLMGDSGFADRSQFPFYVVVFPDLGMRILRATDVDPM